MTMVLYWIGKIPVAPGINVTYIRMIFAEIFTRLLEKSWISGGCASKKATMWYVSSAQSSLFPRMERHYSKKKRLYWHIDYPTTNEGTRIKCAIYFVTDSKEFECFLSKRISALNFSKAVPSFGSTDCRSGCRSHLFILKMSLRQATTSITETYKKLGLRPLLYQH